MIVSKHASVRAQQRGITSMIVELILQFGTPFEKPGNAVEYRLQRRDIKQIIQSLDKANKKAVLINGDTVITVYNTQ